jgi:hypothetical protein
MIDEPLMMQPPETMESTGAAAALVQVEDELGRRQLLLVGPDRPRLVVEVERGRHARELEVRFVEGIDGADVAPVGTALDQLRAAVLQAVGVDARRARHQARDQVVAEVVA